MRQSRGWAAPPPSEGNISAGSSEVPWLGGAAAGEGISVQRIRAWAAL